MRRLTSVLLVLLVVSACGVRPSVVITGGQPPSGLINRPVVFFLSDGQLTPATRTVKNADRLLEELAAGPNRREHREGLRSELPVGVELQVQDASLVVEVSVDPRELSARAVDQITCTATAAEVTVEGGVVITGPGGQLPPQYCGF